MPGKDLYSAKKHDRIENLYRIEPVLYRVLVLDYSTPDGSRRRTELEHLVTAVDSKPPKFLLSAVRHVYLGYAPRLRKM